MEKINFKNLPDTSTPINAENLNQIQNNMENAVNGYVLYDNTDGSNENITLSDSVANYEYIEIYYSTTGNIRGGYTKIYQPNNINCDLSIIEQAGAQTDITRTRYYINNNIISLNVEYAGYVHISGTSISSTLGTNYLKITRVVGYR